MQQNVLDQLIRWHNNWLDSVTTVGSQLWLPDADLSGLNLSGRDIALSNLERATLDGANLARAILERADLAETSLRDANLRGASLDRAYLFKTIMSGADLRGCSLRYARLDWLFLDEAVLGDIDATGASGSIVVRNAFWESNGQRRKVGAWRLTSALEAAGARDIKAVSPPSR